MCESAGIHRYLISAAQFEALILQHSGIRRLGLKTQSVHLHLHYYLYILLLYMYFFNLMVIISTAYSVLPFLNYAFGFSKISQACWMCWSVEIQQSSRIGFLNVLSERLTTEQNYTLAFLNGDSLVVTMPLFYDTTWAYSATAALTLSSCGTFKFTPTFPTSTLLGTAIAHRCSQYLGGSKQQKPRSGCKVWQQREREKE